MDRLNRPDIILLVIASLLLLFQSLIMSNKLPTSGLFGEAEEDFPKLNKASALLECDQIINRDIAKGGSYRWNKSVVNIGMGHGLASSITACKKEARLRQNH